jgi:hypothetical protein
MAARRALRRARGPPQLPPVRIAAPRIMAGGEAMGTYLVTEYWRSAISASRLRRSISACSAEVPPEKAASRQWVGHCPRGWRGCGCGIRFDST